MEKYLEDLKGKSFETLKDEITKIKRKIIYITGDDINRTKKLEWIIILHIIFNSMIHIDFLPVNKKGFYCAVIMH